MSETLFVEGRDRDELIAQIRAEYGYAAKITDLRRVRRGGLFGFFAREYQSVAFELVESEDPVYDQESDPVVAEPVLSMEELLHRSDLADGPSNQPVTDTYDAELADAGFADLLARLLGDGPPELKVNLPAEIAPDEAAAPEPETEPWMVYPPTRSAPPVESSGSMARARLDMLSELRSIGVPFTISPDSGETSLLHAIQQIVGELPVAAPPPSQAGTILVLTGAVDQLDHAVTQLAELAHVPPGAIWRAGVGRSGERVINGPLDAARRALSLRAEVTASIVVIDLDRTVPTAARYSWAAQVIAALEPTVVWAAVDGGRKTEDLRGELDRLGPIDALVVTGAAQTSSPASVWDLDIPVAVLDGRRATPGGWAGLLLDALNPAPPS